MMIACKFEEIYAPPVSDFSKITDKSYSIKDIIEMEEKIIKELNFNIIVTSPLRFLELYKKKFKLSPV